MVDESSKPEWQAEPDAPKQARQLLGVPIGTYLIAVITLVLGFFLGLLTNWWNAKEPHLRVTVSDVITFQGETTEFGIINFSVTNDGSKEATEIECFCTLWGCTIHDAQASPTPLHAVVNKKDDTMLITLDLLNVGETLQISAVAANPASIPTRPDVTVRGRGVVGETVAVSMTGRIAMMVAMSMGIVACLMMLEARLTMLRSRRIDADVKQLRAEWEWVARMKRD